MIYRGSRVWPRPPSREPPESSALSVSAGSVLSEMRSGGNRSAGPNKSELHNT